MSNSRNRLGPSPDAAAVPLLAVTDLAVDFASTQGTVRAVDGVTLTIHSGETHGLVGESGCGKSTLSRAIMGLIAPSRGSIHLNGVDLTRMSRRAIRRERHRLQMVFQDNGAALDPRWLVGRSIAEALQTHGIGSAADRPSRVARILGDVGLPPEAAARYPRAFSGGQRQRIGIARALAVEPELILCDEPVSALDVSVQAQILNLLADLQDRRGIALLFISHDLSVVEHMSDRVSVMYGGRIVETAERRTFWLSPTHPYTRLLFASSPSLGRQRSGTASPPPADGAWDLHRTSASGDGCRFKARCRQAMPRCLTETPQLRLIGPGHHVACHVV
ncbi:ABC transporter ATP-binding protein [Methylobacterium sp. 2A]|jgi:oligopeptide/dipeptide ABC transporter ATP-binding protein|uniref:ABC transporter ATP-binding protein n=1 Tax=Methylobacterium sp. DCY52 TaxID=739139 RepID=UPI001353C51F|nr:ABC transporter ATP-binding protein [Methylobacterium sp. 2A]MWV22362.1 ABC transporter ATP-binding protein [Methylobacterium sp. 2A]